MKAILLGQQNYQKKIDRIEKSGFKLRNTKFIVAGKLCHHCQYKSTTLVVIDRQLMIDNEHHIIKPC